MKFFVPAASTDEQAEDVWQSTVEFAKGKGSDISDRRIYRLDYRHNGKFYVDEIGKPNARNGELVLVILESVTYLVCTGNRGVVRGDPILVGKQEVTLVTDFE